MTFGTAIQHNEEAIFDFKLLIIQLLNYLPLITKQNNFCCSNPKSQPSTSRRGKSSRQVMHRNQS